MVASGRGSSNARWAGWRFACHLWAESVSVLGLDRRDCYILRRDGGDCGNRHMRVSHFFLSNREIVYLFII